MERDPLLNDVHSDEDLAVVQMVLRRRQEQDKPRRPIRQRMPTAATRQGRRQRARLAKAHLNKRAQQQTTRRRAVKESKKNGGGS